MPSRSYCCYDCDGPREDFDGHYDVFIEYESVDNDNMLRVDRCDVCDTNNVHFDTLTERYTCACGVRNTIEAATSIELFAEPWGRFITTTPVRGASDWTAYSMERSRLRGSGDVGSRL